MQKRKPHLTNLEAVVDEPYLMTHYANAATAQRLQAADPEHSGVAGFVVAVDPVARKPT